MDLLHLVDRLEELVANAQRMPIGSRAIVDRRRLLDIVDQMRVAIPSEVREARELVEKQEALQRDAEEEARLTVARAEERAAQLTEDHEVVQVANGRAAEIVQEAQLRVGEKISDANADIELRLGESRRLGEQQMAAADTYARELLIKLDRQLGDFQDSVRSGLEQLVKPANDLAASELDLNSGDLAVRTDAILAAALAPEPGAGNGVGHDSAPDRSRSVLGSLLGRSLTLPSVEEETPPPAEPGVIDDFSMPALDDQPASNES
jgi:hypothetical protein